jgi:hypothetical protein
MSVSEKWIFIFTYLLLGTCITAYKPVVIIHGVLSGNITMLPMAERIKEVRSAFMLDERTAKAKGEQF